MCLKKIALKPKRKHIQLKEVPQKRRDNKEKETKSAN